MEEEKEVKKKRTYKKKETGKKKIVKRNEAKKEEKVIEVKEPEVKEEKTVSKKSDDKFTAIEVVIVMVLSLVLGLILGAFITNKGSKLTNYSSDASRVNDYIEKYYYGTYDKSAYNEQTIMGILSTLDDPYAVFIPKEEAAAYIEASSGEFIGIGLKIFQNEEGYPQVLEVFEGGPSEKAGIKNDDVIIKVDGENIQNQDINDVVSKIKNQKRGEKVTVTVRREDKEMDFDIIRERVIEPSVTVSYSDKTAMIRISNFTDNTYNEFVSAYEKVKEEKSENLILDLRYNSGESLVSATKIAEMFLDKGDVIYKLEDNSGKSEIKDTTKREITLNTVILVSNGTSGISEMFVSSLKENLGLTVIGEKTAGNATIQTLYGLEDGSYIKFTTAKWMTPKGNSVEENGVDVDIEASGLDDYSENDNAFAKAIETLKDKRI